MPIYEYFCDCGSRFERHLPVVRYQEKQICECGDVAKRIISPPMVFVSPDIHYESPIDGKPITNMKARLQDLARSNCVPYDPEQKTDYHRRIKDRESVLDKSIDETVDREISNMPARSKEKLEAEMQQGMTAEPIRISPNQSP